MLSNFLIIKRNTADICSGTQSGGKGRKHSELTRSTSLRTRKQILPTKISSRFRLTFNSDVSFSICIFKDGEPCWKPLTWCRITHLLCQSYTEYRSCNIITGRPDTHLCKLYQRRRGHNQDTLILLALFSWSEKMLGLPYGSTGIVTFHYYSPMWPYKWGTMGSPGHL